MADLAEDAPSPLEGVIQPVIRGEEACIHAIVERQWLMHVAQKTLESNGERRKAPIEADHEKRAIGRPVVVELIVVNSVTADSIMARLILVRPDNAGEFGFIEAKRFFAENMLAGAEGCRYLRRVQMMARRDDRGVDCWIVENLLLVGGAGTKSKFLGSVARVRSVRRAGCNHFGIAASIDRRQQCAGGETARSDKADANGFVTRGGTIGG